MYERQFRVVVTVAASWVVLWAPCFAPAQQPVRGYIDARWNSGYVLPGSAHHARGHFSVCPGCSCFSPTQYRTFAPVIVPDFGRQPGGSWYTGDLAVPIELLPDCPHKRHPTVLADPANGK